MADVTFLNLKQDVTSGAWLTSYIGQISFYAQFVGRKVFQRNQVL